MESYGSIYCDVIDSLKLESNCYSKTYNLMVEIQIINIITEIIIIDVTGLIFGKACK